MGDDSPQEIPPRRLFLLVKSTTFIILAGIFATAIWFVGWLILHFYNGGGVPL